MGLMLKPGTDGALACAVMHVLFRDGLADRAYLEKYTDDPKGLEAHLSTRTPEWAAAITGLSVDEIEAFARLVGTTKKTYLPPRLRLCAPAQRLGRHACGAFASPAVTGCWQYEGGGAFHSNSGIFKLNTRSCSKASRLRDPSHPLSRPFAHRPGADRATRMRCIGGPPVTAHADPEHQPGQRRAGAAAGEAGVHARRSVHLRARAVHDRHGQARRCRAAGDDVPRARRHLQGRRQPARHARTQADRSRRPGRAPIISSSRNWPSGSASPTGRASA